MNNKLRFQIPNVSLGDVGQMSGQRPRGGRWTYALLAESCSTVKIGSSAPGRLEHRINDVQMMCPVELLVIGLLDHNIETALHDRLAYARLHGEWFAYDARVAAVLVETLQSHRISVIAGKELGWQKHARTFGWQGKDPTVP